MATVKGAVRFVVLHVLAAHLGCSGMPARSDKVKVLTVYPEGKNEVILIHGNNNLLILLRIFSTTLHECRIWPSMDSHS